MSDGDLLYIEDQTGGRLGRNIVAHDPRNRRFGVRGVLFGVDDPPRTKTWWRRGVFDQGFESSCTMQAAAGVLFSSPFRLRLDRANLKAYDEPTERFAGYTRAQRYDPWEGEGYDGSSTDAPFKMLREEGAIAQWRWCFGIDDVLRTLSHHGPVSIGTNWFAGMEIPRASGFVKLEGDILGGHAYELVGVNVQYRFVTAVNSWGPGYGMNGRFRLSWEHLGALLDAQGEACTVVL